MNRKVGVAPGTHRVRLFGPRLYAFSRGAVRVIDTETNAALKDQPFKNIEHVLDYEDGARAVGFTKDEVVWLNFDGGEVDARRAALPPDLKGRFAGAAAPQVVILSAR